MILLSHQSFLMASTLSEAEMIAIAKTAVFVIANLDQGAPKCICHVHVCLQASC